MTTIEKFDFNSNFFSNQTTEQHKNIDTHLNSKVADYFEYIYTYPPKIKVKWEGLDDLKEDVFSNYNSAPVDKIGSSEPFTEKGMLVDEPEDAIPETYNFSHYKEGYLTKINSSNFFTKKTKTIQTSLSNIPIYVILNGHGEIILNKPSNLLGPKALNEYVNQLIYDYCGAFDQLVEKRQQLGLFFLNQIDAETYLQEIARADVEGSQMVGLSVHCIGLDSAYKITREHHPGIDFRFVPKFSEVKNLLEKRIGTSDLIVEDEQQQLRLRTRQVNFLPALGKLSRTVLPGFSSHLQKNEYFKGVPIYIVQTSDTSRNLLNESYFNIIGKFDEVSARIVQLMSKPLGLGENWIMQGSLQTVKNSNDFSNHIFFEEKEAINFLKSTQNVFKRYEGSRTLTTKNLVRKPKIFVYNLEDFLEDWEENIYSNSLTKETSEKSELNFKNSHFVTTSENFHNLVKLKENSPNSPLKDFKQTLDLKIRVFNKFVGIFFSVS